MSARVSRFILIVALLLALLPTLRPAPAPYLAALWQGDEHAARLERTAAAEAYRQAAALRPDAPQPYLRLARLYLDWGRPDDSRLAIAAGARRGADEAALERLRMKAAVARADWEAVVEHGQRLLALAPTGDAALDAHRALGRAYIESHAWPSAVGEYLSLVQAVPMDTAAQENLGLLLLPTDPAAAAVHLHAAGTDRAARYLELTAASAIPSYRAILTGRALCGEEEWALAVLHLEQAAADRPNYADAHAYLGYALLQSGFTARAAAHLSLAVSLTPWSVVARTFQGMYYEQQGDLDKARAEYETAYDLDPGNPATCIALGRVWAAAGRYDVAEIWLREAVELEPDDPELWRVLADFYLDHRLDVAGQGTAATERLLALRPDDATAHDLRGWAAFLADDYGTAESHLRRAVALDPTLATAHYHLGVLLTAQDEPSAARMEFIRAVDLDTTGALRPLVARYCRCDS